jgi:8-oxo-dGTP pyrophosphatase MutT (NUDIX family)
MHVLADTEKARFRDMRPPRVESNLYVYHLHKLQRQNYITRVDNLYTLTSRGLSYVDRLSFASDRLTRQPKINTGIIVKNYQNQILLTKKSHQPLIGKWGLPMGKLHEDDASIHQAAERELREKTGLRLKRLHHVGDVYLRLDSEGELISNAFAHLFCGVIRDQQAEPLAGCRWVETAELTADDIIPFVPRMVELAHRSRERFFAELQHEI